MNMQEIKKRQDEIQQQFDVLYKEKFELDAEYERQKVAAFLASGRLASVPWLCERRTTHFLYVELEQGYREALGDIFDDAYHSYVKLQRFSDRSDVELVLDDGDVYLYGELVDVLQFVREQGMSVDLSRLTAERDEMQRQIETLNDFLKVWED